MAENSKDIAYNSLLAIAQKKGFLLYDNIIDIVDELDIDFDDIDRLTDMLLMAGVRIVEDEEELKSYVEKKETVKDYSRIDFDELYDKVEVEFPEMKGTVCAIRNIVPPQRGEFAELLPRAKRREEYAIQRIAEMYARNILKLSYDDYLKYGKDFYELFSEYSLMLLESIYKFRNERSSYNLVNYIIYLMKMKRLDARTKIDCVIEIPTTTTCYINRTNRYPEYLQDLMISDMREIMSIEGTGFYWRWRIDKWNAGHDLIEKIMGDEFSRIRWKAFIDYYDMTMVSLEELQDESEETGIIADELLIPDVCFEKTTELILKEQIETVLNTLTDREIKVLKLRFGLDDRRARTLEEVGYYFNCTRERIRQIEAKALRKLRHPSRSRKLKDYLD